MGDKRLTDIRSRSARKALERLGFELIRQKGSHAVFRRYTAEGGSDVCVLPMGRKPLSSHTLANVLRQAKVSEDEFLENL